MDFSFPDLNFNSVENLPGFEARAAFLCCGKALRGNPVNSASVFREDVDIVPTIVDDTLSYVPWGRRQPANVLTPKSAMAPGCNIV